MRYIVIEEFNEEVNLVHQDGEPFVTESLEEAEDMLSQVQGGFVLPLGDIIAMAKYMYEHPTDSQAIKFEAKAILGGKPY